MHQTSLENVLRMRGELSLTGDQDLFGNVDKKETPLFYEGDLSLIKEPSVAIIGSRDVTDASLEAAEYLTSELIQLGFVIVSGLAKGVDAKAHRTALKNVGKTVAVIGTPLDVTYPAEHAELQHEIARDHLLLSQFAIGTRTFPSNFPRRNKTMAAISSGSLVIQAGEGSGTLHQLKECSRLKKPIFIFDQIIEQGFEWPKKYLKLPFVHVISCGKDVKEAFDA